MNKTTTAAAFLFAAITVTQANAAPIGRDLGSIVADFGLVPGATAGNIDTGAQAVTPNDFDGSSDDTDMIMAFELAGQDNSNTFGFYTFNKATNTVVKTLEVFSGSDQGLPDPDAASVTWDFVAGTATNNTTAISEDFSGAFSGALELGVYLGTIGGTFYSHDVLNAGVRHVGIFELDGGPGLFNAFDLAFAWEDLPAGGDFDYNDMVVLASDLNAVAVPEPASVGLFGLGLAALGLSRRKVNSRQRRK